MAGHSEKEEVCAGGADASLHAYPRGALTYVLRGWSLTVRQRVAEASKAILGTALDITHEALVLSVDLLQLAPIPGLAEAARTLLTIWDTLQLVDFNRMACLRLTERCADILWSVREEILDAGGETGVELEMPLQKLTE